MVARLTVGKVAAEEGATSEPATDTGGTTARWSMIAGLALSTFGGWVHNVREFPAIGILSPEMVTIWLPAVALGVWWLVRPSEAARWAIIAWALLNLILGATLSVVPLPIWPWTPEQSASHYASRLFYAVLQIPLLVVAWRSEPVLVRT